MVPKLRSQSQYLLFVTPPVAPEQGLPVELKDDVVSLHVPLPGQRELERLFDDVTAKIDRARLPRPEVKDKLIQSGLGLTTNQARLAYSRVWARFQKFDEQGIELITSAKQQVIRESGTLEFWPADQGEGEGGPDDPKNRLVPVAVLPGAGRRCCEPPAA